MPCSCEIYCNIPWIGVALHCGVHSKIERNKQHVGAPSIHDFNSVGFVLMVEQIEPSQGPSHVLRYRKIQKKTPYEIFYELTRQKELKGDGKHHTALEQFLK